MTTGPTPGSRSRRESHAGRLRPTSALGWHWAGTGLALDRIAALSPRGTVELERYRPNIVIRTGAPGFPENDWPGRDLHIGPDLAIRVIARTPRCAIPTLEHGDLPRDPEALRVPAGHNRIRPVDALAPQPCAGAYAQVLRPGRIRLGDTVRLA